MGKFLRYFFFFLFLTLFPFVSKTYSAEHFNITNNVTYNIDNNNVAHSVFNISLTNTTSTYYASQYRIKLGFDNVSNIKAFDSTGAINSTLIKTDDGYDILLGFDKKVVGLGNKLNFTITFDTLNISKRQGNVYEVNIPGIANQDDYSEFNVTVKVPPIYGLPTYIKPYLPTNNLTFNKEQLGNSGISIAFGEEQYYSFRINYHLKNPHVFPVKTEIALPASTNYQTVIIDTLNPKPNNVKIDNDGNWLATYSLLSSEQKDILLKGRVKVSLYPAKQPLSEIERIKYLEERKFWERNNSQIQTLSKELKTPRQIYEYVVNNLKYDFTRVTEQKPRIGGENILKNKSSAVCLEFTDLFISLARAAGIPAREVDGFALAQNTKLRPVSLVKDVLHAWPEYYDFDMQTWIMIDPTWGNTTGGIDYFNVLDVDHVSFVIKGENSEYPVPAGGYKVDGKEDIKDVNIEIIERFEIPHPLIDVKSELKDSALAGVPIQGNIVIENKGLVSFPKTFMTVDGGDILLPKETRLEVKEIPPFGTLKIPVYFKNTNFLTNSVATVKIQLKETTYFHSIKITPIYLLPVKNDLIKYLIIGGVCFGIFILVLWKVIRGARNLPFFRR